MEFTRDNNATQEQLRKQLNKNENAINKCTIQSTVHPVTRENSPLMSMMLTEVLPIGPTMTSIPPLLVMVSVRVTDSSISLISSLTALNLIDPSLLLGVNWIEVSSNS